MGIYYNGLTSAKKLLNKRNMYSKAYVGENLVHTGTTLVNYIDWKKNGSYIIVKASNPLPSYLNLRFQVNYQFTYENPDTGQRIGMMGYEYHNLSYRSGHNQQISSYVPPNSIPSAPSGFVFDYYEILNVRPISVSPVSDDLYTYQFREMS